MGVGTCFLMSAVNGFYNGPLHEEAVDFLLKFSDETGMDFDRIGYSRETNKALMEYIGYRKPSLDGGVSYAATIFILSKHFKITKGEELIESYILKGYKLGKEVQFASNYGTLTLLTNYARNKLENFSKPELGNLVSVGVGTKGHGQHALHSESLVLHGKTNPEIHVYNSNCDNSIKVPVGTLSTSTLFDPETFNSYFVKSTQAPLYMSPEEFDLFDAAENHVDVSCALGSPSDFDYQFDDYEYYLFSDRDVSRLRMKSRTNADDQTADADEEEQPDEIHDATGKRFKRIKLKLSVAASVGDIMRSARKLRLKEIQDQEDLQRRIVQRSQYLLDMVRRKARQNIGAIKAKNRFLKNRGKAAAARKSDDEYTPPYAKPYPPPPYDSSDDESEYTPPYAKPYPPPYESSDDESEYTPPNYVSSDDESDSYTKILKLVRRNNGNPITLGDIEQAMTEDDDAYLIRLRASAAAYMIKYMIKVHREGNCFCHFHPDILSFFGKGQMGIDKAFTTTDYLISDKINEYYPESICKFYSRVNKRVKRGNKTVIQSVEEHDFDFDRGAFENSVTLDFDLSFYTDAGASEEIYKFMARPLTFMEIGGQEKSFQTRNFTKTRIYPKQALGCYQVAYITHKYIQEISYIDEESDLIQPMKRSVGLLLQKCYCIIKAYYGNIEIVHGYLEKQMDIINERVAVVKGGIGKPPTVPPPVDTKTSYHRDLDKVVNEANMNNNDISKTTPTTTHFLFDTEANYGLAYLPRELVFTDPLFSTESKGEEAYLKGGGPDSRRASLVAAACLAAITGAAAMIPR